MPRWCLNPFFICSVFVGRTVIRSGNGNAHALFPCFRNRLFPVFQIDRMSQSSKITENACQIRNAESPARRCVQTQCVKLQTFENSPDQSGQHRFGSHFHKSADADLKQISDFIYKIHRRKDLIREQVFGRFRIIRIRLGSGIGKNRHMGRFHPNTADRGGKCLLRIFHQGTVKRGRNREPFHSNAMTGKHLFRFFHPGHRTGNNALIRAVAVGKNHFRTFRPDDFFYVCKGSLHGGHGSGICLSRLSHDTAPCCGQFHQGVLVYPACRVQSAEFPETVSAGCIRIYAEIFQNLNHGQAYCPNRGLGSIRAAQPGFLCCFFFRIHRGRRINIRTQSVLQKGFGIRFFHCFQSLRKTRDQIPAHACVLAALSRKNKSQFAGVFRPPVKDIADASGFFPSPGFDLLQRGRKGFCEILKPIQSLFQNHKDTVGSAHGKFRTGSGSPAGDFLVRDSLRHIAFQFCQPGFQFCGTCTGKSQNFHRSVPGRSRFLFFVFFQYHVKIAAPETKGTDPRSSGMIRIGNPGLCPGVEIKRAVTDLQPGIRLINLEGGRQNLVMQSQHAFDESCRACCGFGMTDHGFDSTHGTAVFLCAATPIQTDIRINLLQRTEFHFIPHTGSGSVSLHQFHCGRRNTGLQISRSKRFHLAFCTGRINAPGFSVTGRANAFDNCINPISVCLCFFQRFEHKQTNPLSQQGSVRIRGKRPHISGGRQNRSFGKAHVHENVIETVHSAADHHFSPAAPDFHQGHVHGSHGTGARGIHSAVGSAQIQAVCDSARNDIAQQTGKGIFLPGNIGIGNMRNHFFRLFRRNSGFFQSTAPVRMSQPCAQRNDQFLCSGRTQNHTGAIPVKFPILTIARVFQRNPGCQQSHQLGCVCGLQRTRGNAEFRGIKRHRGKISAPCAIDMIRFFGVFVIIICRRPVGFRHFANRVLPFKEQTPVLFQS